MRYTSISDEKAESYRGKIARVIVRGSAMKNKSGPSNTKKLHIPVDSDTVAPLCNSVSHSDMPWVEKDIAVYPPGHKSICKRCIAIAENETKDACKQYTDTELLDHLESVLHEAPFNTVSADTYDEYRSENQPSASLIEKRFVSWTAAKAKTEYDP